jgi:ABC-type multidrug transport system fused ATPase/permease subunit
MIFGWAGPFISKGFSHFSSKDDAHINRELDPRKSNYSITRLVDVLWFGRDSLLWTGSIFLVSNFISLWSVKVVKSSLESLKIVIQFNEQDQLMSLSYNLALFLSLQVASSFMTCQGEYIVSRLGLQIRHYLVSLIAYSVLNSDRQSASGSLVQSMTVDVSAVENIFTSVHFLWASPIQCILLMGYLYHLIGNYAIIGTSVLLLYSLVQGLGLVWSKRFRQVALLLQSMY